MNMSNTLSKELIEANKQNQSWRARLSWISEWLNANTSVDPNESKLRIVYSAAYLHLLKTNIVLCERDEEAHPPSHHAQLAQSIMSGLATHATSGNAPLRRRLYDHLPSYDLAFTRHNALKRINEIANRDDLPKHLADDIKRNILIPVRESISPAVLMQSRDLLTRINSDPHDYRPALIQQLHIFVRELENYFGDADLFTLLKEVSQSTPNLTHHIRRLIDCINESEEQAIALMGLEPYQPEIKDLVKYLRINVELRERLLVNSQDTSARAQRWRQLDLRLEENAYSSAKILINRLAEYQEDSFWLPALTALGLIVKHLQLNEIPETAILRQDLNRWQGVFALKSKSDFLRLKAVVERGLQLIDNYTSNISLKYISSLDQIAQALGVSDQDINKIRKSVIEEKLPFLLAQLCQLILRRINSKKQNPAWIALSQGKAKGVLVRASSFKDLPKTDYNQIALLEELHGSEHITEDIQAILLKNPIPYLSPLALKARQEKIALAFNESATEFKKINNQVGDLLNLTINSDGIIFGEHANLEEGSGTEQIKSKHSAVFSVKQFERTDELITEHFKREYCGDKGQRISRLKQLSSEDNLFKIPKTTIIPFGVFESTVATCGLSGKIATLVDTCQQEKHDRRALEYARTIREHIKSIDIDSKLLDKIINYHGNNKKLILRASSNTVEPAFDLGAGLYENIPNIPSQKDALSTAIKRIWSSLYSEKALLWRRKRRIPQSTVHMSLIIQEFICADHPLSFALHTADPTTPHYHEAKERAYVEMVYGFGGVLPSAMNNGTPFRFNLQRPSGEISIISFASYDQALMPDEKQGLIAKRVDYGKLEIALSTKARAELGKKLIDIAESVEAEFETPQVIEGIVVDQQIFLINSADAHRAQRIDSAPEHYTHRTSRHKPMLYGLMDYLISDDDSLFSLAYERFKEYALGAEFYAPTIESLRKHLEYAPTTLSMAHLSRKLDLLNKEDRRTIIEFARCFVGKIHGFVLHDQQHAHTHQREYLDALNDLASALKTIQGTPIIYIEYASDLNPNAFIDIFSKSDASQSIGVCMDIGHIGTYAARQSFFQKHPGIDICSLSPYHPQLSTYIEALQHALEDALPLCHWTIDRVSELNRPLHIHLHDGHPLWTQSPFGVCDHMSFLDVVPIPFQYRGARYLKTLYGIESLQSIVGRARRKILRNRLTMTLEIHPQMGRLPLTESDRPPLRHWKNIEEAERMNYWLEILIRNANLTRSAISL